MAQIGKCSQIGTNMFQTPQMLYMTQNVQRRLIKTKKDSPVDSNEALLMGFSTLHSQNLGKIYSKTYQIKCKEVSDQMILWKSIFKVIFISPSKVDIFHDCMQHTLPSKQCMKDYSRETNFPFTRYTHLSDKGALSWELKGNRWIFSWSI